MIPFGLMYLIGCEDSESANKTVEESIITDVDGDGYMSDEDCDDNNSAFNPSVEEVCDGLDNNCDGNVDEGVTTTIYVDADGDGYGNENLSEEACGISSGYSPNGTDCDDINNNVFPGNDEQCDGIDNDCNDVIDDDDPNLDLLTATTFYADNDGDGFGDITQHNCDVKS